MLGSPFRKATFIDPMILLPTSRLPEGADWLYELKLDGYRALAIKTGGKVRLVSRNDNDFSGRYPAILKALQKLPDDTVIDGEVVALQIGEILDHRIAPIPPQFGQTQCRCGSSVEYARSLDFIGVKSGRRHRW